MVLIKPLDSRRPNGRVEYTVFVLDVARDSFNRIGLLYMKRGDLGRVYNST